MANKSFASCLAIFTLSLIISVSAYSQQVADTLFNPNVGKPAFEDGNGPVILIDEGHYNFHTMSGRYLPFAKLLKKDGYRVKPNPGKFTATGLEQAKILVISNALAEENDNDWTLPTPSAFDSAEIMTVKNWVHNGGSLLLIVDHMPFPGAAEQLGAAFGVLMGNGFAVYTETQDGRMRFSRADGSLGDHPVTRGRNQNERIDSVISFTGQAFRLEGNGQSLMVLGRHVTLLMPEVAWQFSRLTPSLSASGMLQGAILTFGKGRVAVFGEAAMFSAQLGGPNRVPMGMNDPAAPQNPQFLLNVIHWLSGIL